MRDRARLAVSISFLAFGLTQGGLIPRLPALKDHLHLTDGQVGLALLGASLGGVIGSLSSRFIVRRNAPAYVRGAIPALCAVAIGPGLAPSLATLVGSLFLVGFLWGFIDVLVNALGAGLERARGRHLINGFHGFWSLGAFAGSLVAGVAATLAVAPVLQFVATGLIISAASPWFIRDLPTLAEPDTASLRRGAVSLTAAVIVLAAMGFAAVITEGGTSDWSALFLRQVSHAGPGLAAAGFSGFALAGMLVRFRADSLTARTSRVTVARIGAAMAAGGLSLAIAFPTLPSAIAGFAVVGMGIAVVVPLVFAAGANLGRGGTSLAFVMALSYLGTIAGPPLIGATADHLGLRTAMAIPLVAAMLVFALAGSLAGRNTSPAREAELAIGRG